MNKKTAYFELCVREDFFTSGDSRQYSICLEFAKSIGEIEKDICAIEKQMLLVKLISMTYICSDTDKFTYSYIANKVEEIFK